MHRICKFPVGIELLFAGTADTQLSPAVVIGVAACKNGVLNKTGVDGIGCETALHPRCGTGIFDPDIAIFVVKGNTLLDQTVFKNAATVKALPCHAGTERDDPALDGVFAGTVADNVAAGTVELIFITEKQTVFNDGIGDVVNGNTVPIELLSKV